MMPRLETLCWKGALCASVLVLFLSSSSSADDTRVEATVRNLQAPRRLLESNLPGKTQTGLLGYHQHDCVREISNTSISPQSRGPTAGKSFTYEKKYYSLEKCFEECPTHYVVHDKDSGTCYCWMEESCKPKGFCADGGCSGSSSGVWESEEGVVVYDQTACYDGDRDCDDDDSSSSIDTRTPEDSCVREISNTSISPHTRGPTAGKSFTYGKKYFSLKKCFEECPTHYIVHVKSSWTCYCWMEESCKPKGFCADGGCSGSSYGVWESEEGVVVYDQTACYDGDRDCDDDASSSDSSLEVPPPRDDSSDSSSLEVPPPRDDSSDSSSLEAPPPRDDSSDSRSEATPGQDGNSGPDDKSCNLSWEPRDCVRSDRDDPAKQFQRAPEGYGCTAANSEVVFKVGDTWTDRPTGDEFTYKHYSFKYCMHNVAARSFSRSVVTYDDVAKECRIGCKVEDMECLPGVQMGRSCDSVYS